MTDNATSIITPSKPNIVKEEDNFGVYEIEGLYPGYGHTLGNSLRRIILSSLPGVAVTTVKIDDVSHEFSSLEGVQEDVIGILLNLKRVRMKMHSDEPQVLTVSSTGTGEVTAGDLGSSNGLVDVVNPEHVVAHLTDKKASLSMEVTVERGLGFVPKEDLKKEKVDIGTIALDAVFTPIRRVSYEVENMRVGDRTDFNRLRISIETDSTVSPREALEGSIGIMINQLKAVIGFQESDAAAEEEFHASDEISTQDQPHTDETGHDEEQDVLKTRIETIDLSTRTMNALTNANIRTLGGLVRKKDNDLLELEGLGDKGLGEIRDMLSGYGLSLKEDA